MKSKYFVSRCSVCFFVLAFAFMTFGFNISNVRAELVLGVDIPEDEPVVKLETVIENSAAYDGKTIVMKGLVSGQCAALCEFFFRDGLHTATIYPQGFKFPKLKRGKPVTIYTQVISGEEKVVFSALGLKME